MSELAVDTWQDVLASDLGNPNVRWHVLDPDGFDAGSRDVPCLPWDALVLHSTWPDAINGEVDREVDVLTFMASRPAACAGAQS